MSDLLGSTISHYRILGLLGSGGMGSVYRAHDERLDRDLALKVLLAGTLNDETARARLMREARTASSLNHPHIAHIYEVGEDRGNLFIAMELVEGRTLRDSIPTGGLTAELLIRFSLQIADALAYAHERGVIHRDLKSTNIMITPESWAKVLDFGLAKRVAEADPERPMIDPNLTATGMVLGTPNHLPPEVLFGAPADARSDVWALGVVLYEMASAKFPFGGGTLPELANAIASETPAPLSGRVPIGIQAIIGRCLTKEPAKRFTNGGEVRAAIEALAQRDPRRAAGGAGRRIGMPVAAVLLGAIAVTFGVEGLRERITGAAGHPRIRSLAVLPLANLSGDPAQEYFADGMTEELITALAPIPSLKVISRTSIMRFKSTTQPIGDIAHTLGVDAIVEGSVLHAGNRVRITAQLIEASSDRHLWAKSFERDFRDVLALQSDVARDIASEIQLQVSPQVRARLASPRVVNPEAYELYLKGRFEWEKLTDASVRKAIEYFEHAHAIDPGDARYSSGMADAYLVLAQVVGSISPAEGMAKAKEYARRALEADENSAEAHASMGAALFFGDWNWREAERQLQRSIELNPGYSTARLVYSALLSASGRTEEAVQQDRRALESDPLSLIVNLNAVETLRLAGRFEQAIAQSRRAILANPDSPMSHGTLYKVYEAKGDFLAALDVLDRHLPEEAGGKAYIARLRKAYTESGASGYWRAVLDHALAQPDAKSLPAIQYAMAYARIGDRERALGYLKSAYEAHSGDLVFMNAEPCFTTLRDEPRFKAIARRVGIPAVAGS